VIDELAPRPPVAGLWKKDGDGNGLRIDQVANFTRALLVRARGRVQAVSISIRCCAQEWRVGRTQRRIDQVIVCSVDAPEFQREYGRSG
jgi:hypothetical protein